MKLNAADWKFWANLFLIRQTWTRSILDIGLIPNEFRIKLEKQTFFSRGSCRPLHRKRVVPVKISLPWNNFPVKKRNSAHLIPVEIR
ncbi:MAG: hypothetical protein COV67_07655 [Nitrospinae bacterium CG11_big_fil_rev_8_21_14_0_20_56_8]|nr:MAG: hypothetical protein COV67_07655 [Nitrospinae bacterium CG11_big_fil_rev_8_21_14_0_20_56_8]